MNTQDVLDELKATYPGGHIKQLPPDNPTEIVCELGGDGTSSSAIAIIDRSAPHYHRHTVETYILRRGQVIVHVDGQPHALEMGKPFVINPGQIHWAEGGGWVEVLCRPPYSPQDHILVESQDL